MKKELVNNLINQEKNQFIVHKMLKWSNVEGEGMDI